MSHNELSLVLDKLESPIDILDFTVYLSDTEIQELEEENEGEE